MSADEAGLETARRALRAGELVVYPTDTLYGLGCLANREDAVQRLLELTGRPPGKGLSALFSSLQRARAWAIWTDSAGAIARSFLPGPLTLVLEASPKAPQTVQASEGTIGIRHVDRETPNRLARVGPLVATSANLHGRAPPETVDEAREIFGDAVEAYVDEGRLTGPASTVVDARRARPTVIREGPIPEDEILEATSRGR